MVYISWSLDVQNLKSVEKRNPYGKINSSLRKMLKNMLLQENPNGDLNCTYKNTNRNSKKILTALHQYSISMKNFKTQNKNAEQI